MNDIRPAPPISPSDPPKRTSFRWAPYIRAALTLVVLAALISPFRKAMGQVDWAAVAVRPGWLAAGFLLVVSSWLTGALVIKRFLSLFGGRVTMAQAFVLHTLPQVGKYLPTKAFTLAGYMGLARSFGVGLTISGSSTLMTTGMGLASATFFGLLLVIFQPAAAPPLPPHYLGLAALGLIVMLILLYPAVFRTVLNFGLHILGRSPFVLALPLPPLLGLFLLIGLLNMLFLTGVGMALFGLADFPGTILPLLIGTNSLANVIGFLALFAPAGIGVREGIMLLALSPVLGPGPAGLATLLLRVVQTIADITMVLAGLVVWQVERYLTRKRSAVAGMPRE